MPTPKITKATTEFQVAASRKDWLAERRVLKELSKTSTQSLTVLITCSKLKPKLIKQEELMSIQPLADRVVAIKDQAIDKTASGILLGNSEEKSNSAVVESTGPGVKTLKKGDRIVYKDYSATEVKINGTEYLIIKEEDVLATIK